LAVSFESTRERSSDMSKVHCAPHFGRGGGGAYPFGRVPDPSTTKAAGRARLVSGRVASLRHNFTLALAIKIAFRK
jgi:hypothetical protein